MRPALRRSAHAMACVLIAATVAAAQNVAETFTATASVKKGAASVSAPVRVTVTRYATEAEREGAKKAIRAGGTSALRALLAKSGDAGFIELGERRTPIKFVSTRPLGDGSLLTAITAEPILFFGAGVPGAKPANGFEVAIAILEVKNDGTGTGDLSPAAKVGLDEGGAVLIEDYGATVVWLNSIARAKK